MSSIEDKLLAFYYKWKRFEKQHDIAIIDFDLVGLSSKFPGTFRNRDEVLARLEELKKEYNELPTKDLVVSAKLEAASYFLRVLMGKIIPFREYVRKTVGIVPQYIPKIIIDEQLSKTIVTYKALGYSYTKNDLERYIKEHTVSKQQIESVFREYEKKFIPKILEWLELKIDLKYKLEFVDLDVYWQNWISTDDKGEFLIQFNTNPKHHATFGEIEFLISHEICSHAVQSKSWQAEVSKGKLHRLLGLTSVFTPEQFFSEGIAETLAYFYPDFPFSSEGILSWQADNLYWMVWSNAHLMAAKGVDYKRIVAFIRSYLPLLTRNKIEKDIQIKMKDPLGTYQYVYGISLYYHSRIAAKLSDEQKKQYVKNIYTHMFRPEDIINQYDLQ